MALFVKARFKLTLTPASQFFLLVFRVGGLFTSAPFFSSESIPNTGKVVGFFGTVILVAQFSGIDIFFWKHILAGNTPMDEQFNIVILIMGILEFILGMTIGMILKLSIFSVQVSLEFLSNIMGLMASNMVDPFSDIKSNVLGQLVILFLYFALLSMGGLEYMLKVFAESMQFTHLGLFKVERNFWLDIYKLIEQTIESGLILSLPIVGLVICINLFMGVVSRVAPQIQVFIFGFTLTIVGGLIMLYFYYPNIQSSFLNDFQETMDYTRAFFGRL